jgi:arylsulfatase A-like enzyme
MTGNRMDPALVAFLTACILGGAAASKAAQDRPNIILILADDMGYSDIGCYGSEIRTPNIDRLAAEGIRFSHAYNMAQCTPTRASLMTGQRNTPHQGFSAENAQHWLPQLFRDAGYGTAMTGKWHVSGHPMDRGFDYFYGIEEGVADHFTASGRLQSGRTPVEPAEGFYSTDIFTDYALGFLDKIREDEKPFFLYLAYTAPHDPLQAPIEDVERYRGIYSAGWHAIQDGRIARLQEKGLLDRDVQRPEWPENMPRWDELNPRQQRLEELRMEVYAAMVDRMDQNIGRVLAYLEKAGQRDNTIILFMSDNGANPFEAGRQRRMEQRPVRPDQPGSLWSTGPAWAHVSNTPFRLYKRNLHEGGICTPLIIRGPGMEGYTPGGISGFPVHVLDFMPTFLAWAGAAERIPDAAEGENLREAFNAGEEHRLDFGVIDSHFEHRLVREGDWKLVSVQGRPWELYRMDLDPLETDDLVRREPERVKSMAERWLEDWRSVSDHQQFVPQHRTGPNARMDDRGGGTRYVPLEAPEGW